MSHWDTTKWIITIKCAANGNKWAFLFSPSPASRCQKNTGFHEKNSHGHCVGKTTIQHSLAHRSAVKHKTQSKPDPRELLKWAPLGEESDSCFYHVVSRKPEGQGHQNALNTLQTEDVTNLWWYSLIKAETLFSFGSYGHSPFPESSLPGSKRKMYSCHEIKKKWECQRSWIKLWCQDRNMRQKLQFMQIFHL